jgi:hypothetical protein
MSKRSKRKSRKSKKKKNKKKKDKKESNDEPSSPSNPIFETTKIDKDEIPEIPRNRFLDRFGGEEKDRETLDREKFKPIGSTSDERRGRDDRHKHSSDGKKIKGRGRMTFKSDARGYSSRARSRSATPPHWKSNKTISLTEFQRRKKEQERDAVETNRRAELRRQRHEEKAEKEKRYKEREQEYRNKIKLEQRKKDEKEYSDEDTKSKKRKFDDHTEEKVLQNKHVTRNLLDPDVEEFKRIDFEEKPKERNALHERKRTSSGLNKNDLSPNERKYSTNNRRENDRRVESRRSVSSDQTSDSSRHRASSSPSPVRNNSGRRRERPVSVDKD